MRNAQSKHNKRNRYTITSYWSSWEVSDFCALSPNQTWFVLEVNCISAGLVFLTSLTRRQMFLIDFLQEASSNYKLPTVTSTILKMIKQPHIFIIGHSNICLVLETLVSLSSASCICNSTFWCQSIQSHFCYHVLPLSSSHAITQWASEPPFTR